MKLTLGNHQFTLDRESEDGLCLCGYGSGFHKATDGYCESCETVGIKTPATTIRNRERVCGDCAAEIDQRAAHQSNLRATAYDKRGIRK